MRKITVALVAVMILFAGCSGGGGGAASPTEEAADSTEEGTPMEGTPMDDGEEMDDGDDGNMDGEQPESPRAIANIGSSSSSSGQNPLANATDIDVTLYNGTQNINVLIQNDTAANTQLLQLSSSEGGTTTLYSTSEYTALRNTTSGETEYAGPDGNIGFGVAFGSILVVGGAASYAGTVEWEPAGTTTVDGESAYVYEADSLNQTALDQQRQGQQSLTPQFDQSDVQSVDGRIVVGTDGRIHSINIEIETSEGTYGTDLTIGYDDVTIDQPDWVDESQAP